MTKKELLNLLKKAEQQYQIIAPIKKGNKVYVSLARPADIDWSGRLPDNSYKAAFLPPQENIITFTGKDIAAWVKENLKSQIVWGMNLLDLQAFNLFEKVFAKDPYYQARRAQTIVVGYHAGALAEKENSKLFNCQADDGLLCHLDFDLFVIEQQRHFDLYCGSTAGQDFLRLFGVKGFYNVPVKKEKVSKVNEQIKELSEIVAESVDDPIWQELGKICLACGKCSVSCPTCYCFDINEEFAEDSIKRCREWGNCFHSDFGLVAGGYNFQTTIAERLRFWYWHKFVRIPQQTNYSSLGCVSCLRCFRHCPAGINIKKVLSRLKESHKNRKAKTE